MKWVKRRSFRDQALFLDNEKVIFNITRWKGSQQPSYCIYDVGCANRNHTLHYLDGIYTNSFSIMQRKHMPDASLGNHPFCYFPHLYCSVNSLPDDYQLELLLHHLPYPYLFKQSFGQYFELLYIFCCSSIPLLTSLELFLMLYD